MTRPLLRGAALALFWLCASLPAAGADPAPYLDAAAFEARFIADAPLSACPLGALDLMLVVSVSIARDGAVTQATVGGAPDAVAVCLEDALAAWRLQPQREPGQPVRFSLPVRAGQPLAPQGLRAPTPVVAPVLVRLPPGLSPETRAALAPMVSPPSVPAPPAAPAAAPPDPPPRAAE